MTSFFVDSFLLYKKNAGFIPQKCIARVCILLLNTLSNKVGKYVVPALGIFSMVVEKLGYQLWIKGTA